MPNIKHSRNCDDMLNEGGTNQVSASEIKTFINSKGGVSGVTPLGADSKVPAQYLPSQTIVSPITTTGVNKVKSVATYGNYASISLAQGNGGFALFNIVNPNSPVFLGKGSSTWSVNKSIFLNNNRLFVLVDTNSPCIESWNITNKSSPTRDQIVTVAGTTKFYDLQVSGNYIFTCDYNTGKGIYIFDITNPALILYVGNIAGGNLSNVRVRGNILWTVDYVAKVVKKYDISNITSPNLLWTSAVITAGINPTGLEINSTGTTAVVWEDNGSIFYYFKDTGSGLTLTSTVNVQIGTFDAQGSSACIMDETRDILYMSSWLGIFMYRLSTGAFLGNFFPTTGDVRGNTSGVGAFYGNQLVIGARTTDRLVLIKDPYLMI